MDAKEVIEQMIAIRRGMESDDQRAQELSLTSEEIAFYDAVAGNFMTICDQILLRDLVHEGVQTLKRNLKADWTESSRQEIRAGVRSTVGMVLRTKGLQEKDLEPFLGSVIVQVLYYERPLGWLPGINLYQIFIIALQPLQLRKVNCGHKTTHGCVYRTNRRPQK